MSMPIGTLNATLACTLVYLDFRVSNIEWRSMRPDLAAWFDSASERPSMLANRTPCSAFCSLR
jgi:glutathione S-transferase